MMATKDSTGVGVMYTKESSDTDQLLEKKSNSRSSTNKKKRILIMSSIVLISLLVAITLILLFVVYYDEVFGESSSSDSSQPGMIGLWPCYGGNLGNQQTSPYPELIEIDSTNILNMETHCEYESEDAIGTLGFTVIDDEYNAYFTDLSGYITSINIESCTQRWRTNIAEIMGYNSSQVIVGSHNTLTLFQDDKGRKGALFSAPSRRPYPSGSWSFLNYPEKAGCWAIALNILDGSLLWELEVAENYNPLNWRCNIHGFFVDGEYAYGGLAQSGNHPNGSQIIGRMIKININKPEVVDVWYPFDPQLTISDDPQNYPTWKYLGAGSYNFPAIIDDYLVFGTGQIYRTPKYIDDCLSGDFQQVPLNESVSMDICGNNRSNDRFWRCLEKDVYPDSLIILNKNTFKLQAGIPMQGIDVYYYNNCWNDDESFPFCPSLGNQGPNGDVAAVATFKYNGKLYAAASQKPSQLLVVEVPSGKLVVSKSFGPWTNGANFNMAVDEESGIGILTTRGASMYQINPNIRICSGSSVHAINLMTGNTLWQLANPYGRINETDCWERSFPLDRSINQSCSFGEWLENGQDDQLNDIIIPSIITNENVTIINNGNAFSAPVTIIKNMVFIPGSSGDIWVHNLLDGKFITNFQCPIVELQDGRYNRYGFKGGVSVVNKYIAYYCGDYGSSLRNGNIFVVQKLN